MKPINELTPFGKFIREFRRNTGESMESMAKHLGVSRTYLTQLEVGVSERVITIPIYLLDRITRQYYLSPDDVDKLVKAVKETNKDIQRLDFANVSDEDKEKILNYAYELIVS